ncbi:hypothetical protein GWI33_004364 [Rhynchophorus ferrugineus]|uniref:Uncharacterized protein n=1 Tax=Rhynchophorus ferrugineus TaxID=354439 RepID=A0A834MLA3_RHYFE|nr:hypothetical protein GWI33_004364 [Rhynchophorus ferrugineus]
MRSYVNSDAINQTLDDQKALTIPLQSYYVRFQPPVCRYGLWGTRYHEGKAEPDSWQATAAAAHANPQTGDETSDDDSL